MNIQAHIKRQLASGLMMAATVLSIAIARFERDPQSCGMATVQTKRDPKQPADQD